MGKQLWCVIRRTSKSLSAILVRLGNVALRKRRLWHLTEKIPNDLGMKACCGYGNKVSGSHPQVEPLKRRAVSKTNMKAIPLSYSEFMQKTSKERIRHERATHKLESGLLEFQKTCLHQNTRFQGDPAGGNDSCYICNLCDKIV